jgi:alpha-beta hydrolase superfamily lysophospholipase
MQLHQTANALNEGVELLHERYGFKRLHVAAHSMGGLVARDFLIHEGKLGHRLSSDNYKFRWRQLELSTDDN